MLFSGIERISGPWWHEFDSRHAYFIDRTIGLATPSNFCRPATPTGSLLFATPRPERPSDPANPARPGPARDTLGPGPGPARIAYRLASRARNRRARGRVLGAGLPGSLRLKSYSARRTASVSIAYQVPQHAPCRIRRAKFPAANREKTALGSPTTPAIARPWPKGSRAAEGAV